MWVLTTSAAADTQEGIAVFVVMVNLHVTSCRGNGDRAADG